MENSTYDLRTRENCTRVPNSETLEALNEVEQMKKNPTYGKSYTDVDQMMKELLA